MRRASRGSHQFTWRNGPRRMGGANNNSSSADRKPLVLSTYLDAQEHLPYADDSAAVTPMSEDNGAIVVPPYALNNLGKCWSRTAPLCVRQVTVSLSLTVP
jgi:voltage-gated sodium channel type II alpha